MVLFSGRWRRLHFLSLGRRSPAIGPSLAAKSVGFMVCPGLSLRPAVHQEAREGNRCGSQPGSCSPAKGLVRATIEMGPCPALGNVQYGRRCSHSTRVQGTVLSVGLLRHSTPVCLVRNLSSLQPPHNRFASSSRVPSVEALGGLRVPLCLMMFGYLAALEAQEDLDAEEGQYFLIAKEDESETGGCVVLRSLAGGVLVRVPTENQIQFVPWASIKRVERRAESPTGTRACRWWGVGCSDTVETTASSGS